VQERLPPHNLEAEKSVLGGLLVDPSSIDLVQNRLAPTDFYKPSHVIVYEAILALVLKSENVDFLTVSHYLTSKNQLSQVGGAAYLAELAEATLGAANLEAYVEIVANTSLLRKLIQTSQKVVDRAFRADFESVDAFLNEVEAEVFKLSENNNKEDLVRSSEIVKDAINRIEELYKRKADITGISSGFKDLDKITAGLHGGELIIVAARPSMGKTAFSLNLAQHMVLREKKSIAYFSLEMGKEQLMMRMLASEAKIDMGQLRVGRVADTAWHDLITAASKLSEAKFFVDETSGLSPYELRAKCRRLKARFGLDCVIVDYSEISKTLKEISKELSIPVIALAQLNRGVESRTDRRPLLSDLRESGSIEQDADIIMMLYRDEYYEKEASEYKGQAEIIIAKHRNGPTGVIRLAFKANTGTFMDLVSNYEPSPSPPAKVDMDVPRRKGPVKNFAPGVET
jgi:replicative DNA helicase